MNPTAIYSSEWSSYVGGHTMKQRTLSILLTIALLTGGAAQPVRAEEPEVIQSVSEEKTESIQSVSEEETQMTQFVQEEESIETPDELQNWEEPESISGSEGVMRLFVSVDMQLEGFSLEEGEAEEPESQAETEPEETTWEETETETEEPVPTPIDLSRGKIRLSDTVYTYDGKAKTPEVSVVLGETQLVQNVDYTLVYENNTAIGTGSVTVSGMGAYTGTLTATFSIQMAQPKLEKAENTVAGVSVKWSKVNGTEGYYVYRKTENSNWKRVGTVERGNTVSFVDTTVSSGTSYVYTVRAYVGSIRSGYDAAGISIRYLSTPSLNVVNGVKGVTVTWNQIKGATDYNIYRKSGSGNWRKIGTTGKGTVLRYSDQTASSGTTYTYTVRAVSGNVMSSYDSAGKSLKYLSKPVVTEAYNGVAGATVKWKKVNGAEGYHIYRKNGNGNWKRVGTVKGVNTLRYADRNASSGTVYTYTIRAYVGSTLSGYDVAGKSVHRLAQPVVKDAVNGVYGVTVKWGKVNGATGYNIYRKSSNSDWKKIGTVKGGNTVTYSDRTAASGKDYTYTVRASYGTTLSSYDTKGKSLHYLSRPVLNGISSGGSGVTVSWKKVTGASGYRVYRKSGNSDWSRIGTVNGGFSTAYTDKTIDTITHYVYTIRAYFGDTLSGYDPSGVGIDVIGVHMPSDETIALANRLDKTVKGYGQGREVDGQNRPAYALSMQNAYGKYNATFLNSNPNAVSFIFTCGWEYSSGGRPNTEKVLDILKQKGVKAAFFVTHEYASHNPGIVRRIINEGHILGSHGYAHPDNGISSLSVAAQIEDTMRMHNYIRDTFGYEMRAYNFSSSYWSDSSMALISGMGYQICFYSINYRDWLVNQQLPVSQAYAHLVNSMHPGTIYMLHTVSDTNVAILGSVIDEARRRGYTVTSVY